MGVCVSYGYSSCCVFTSFSAEKCGVVRTLRGTWVITAVRFSCPKYNFDTFLQIYDWCESAPFAKESLVSIVHKCNLENDLLCEFRHLLYNDLMKRFHLKTSFFSH